MEPKNLLLRLPAIQASKKRSWEKKKTEKPIQPPEPYKTLTFTLGSTDFYSATVFVVMKCLAKSNFDW